MCLWDLCRGLSRCRPPDQAGLEGSCCHSSCPPPCWAGDRPSSPDNRVACGLQTQQQQLARLPWAGDCSLGLRTAPPGEALISGSLDPLRSILRTPAGSRGGHWGPVGIPTPGARGDATLPPCRVLRGELCKNVPHCPPPPLSIFPYCPGEAENDFTETFVCINKKQKMQFLSK